MPDLFDQFFGVDNFLTVKTKVKTILNLKFCQFYFEDIVLHVNTIFDLIKLFGDASAKCTYKCQSENSQTSTASKRIFDRVTPSTLLFT